MTAGRDGRLADALDADALGAPEGTALLPDLHEAVRTAAARRRERVGGMRARRREEHRSRGASATRTGTSEPIAEADPEGERPPALDWGHRREADSRPARPPAGFVGSSAVPTIADVHNGRRFARPRQHIDEGAGAIVEAPVDRRLDGRTEDFVRMESGVLRVVAAGRFEPFGFASDPIFFGTSQFFDAPSSPCATTKKRTRPVRTLTGLLSLDHRARHTGGAPRPG